MTRIAAADRQDAPTRPVILHISSDYPNPIRTPTTTAVERLVDRLTLFDQVVISLQRIGNPFRCYWKDLGEVNGRRLIAHGYFALPFGVGMIVSQFLLARRIGRFLTQEGIVPTTVHSHRFTFEGIAAWLVARRRKAALFYSVRGEVEAKVFRAKPTYRPLFRRMARDATRAFYVSAWFREGFERVTGIDPRKTRTLPNFVENARPKITPVAPEPILVTALNLDALEKKGLPTLLQAFALAGDALKDVRLEIIGYGSAAGAEAAKALIVRHGLQGRAFLRGYVPHAQLLEEFPSRLAMVLPSRDETFGMVYLEALFAGTPVLYSKMTGIDGYLDGLAVGEAADPHDPEDVARALTALVGDNDAYRKRIEAEAGELFRRFDPVRNLELYRDDVLRVTAGGLETAVIEVHRDCAPLEAEWRALEEGGHVTAFQRYDFVAPLYAAFQRHQRAQPLMVVVRPQAGAAPMMILPLCAYRERGLRMISVADLRVADYCAPILAADFPAEDAAGFLDLWRRIEAMLPDADVIRLRKLPEKVGGLTNPLLHLPIKAPFSAMAHGVRIGTPWPEKARMVMSSKALSGLRRRERQLNAIAPVSFASHSGDGQAESLYETLAHQRIDRFGRLQREDMMREAMWSEFYRDLTLGQTARAYGRVIGLKVGDAFAATGFGLVHDDAFHLLMMAFDMDGPSHLAPGRVMLFKAMEAFAEDGMTYFDLTVGDEPYKQSLGADDRVLYEALSPRSVKGRLGVAVWQGRRWLQTKPRLHALVKRMTGRS
ncbi:GNAT family N-acetyltransferase [Rhodoligotrophos appendicifer]|uniref:GNAT family N-acetyltransferase n=1 Tax=Rhodoligotrophos appendicifer TaxID=987056 RepID=UPI001FE8A780|nr:GNAT family N-acetyltransferase [Rhodoligotrophos appendicifer]